MPLCAMEGGDGGGDPMVRLGFSLFDNCCRLGIGESTAAFQLFGVVPIVPNPGLRSQVGEGGD